MRKFSIDSTFTTENLGVAPAAYMYAKSLSFHAVTLLAAPELTAAHMTPAWRSVPTSRVTDSGSGASAPIGHAATAGQTTTISSTPIPGGAGVVFSGNPDLDGLLSGFKWTSTNLTYSFPTSGSFYTDSVYSGSYNDVTSTHLVFNATQQTAVRNVLAMIASLTGLTFTEITETATTHANLRFSQDASTTAGHEVAFTFLPTGNTASGDVWFGTTTGETDYTNPQFGNWGMATIMHEIGHALGLKHGHEDLTSSGGSAALPAAHDGWAWSLMTYRSDPGNVITYEGDHINQPQSYMQDDIAALQYLYGANFDSHGGPTEYIFDALTGEMSIREGGRFGVYIPQGAPSGNVVFRTIWDGGGYDIYDFTNFTTSVTVDLRPGGWSTFSATQLADTRPYESGVTPAPGNIANALLYNGDTRALIEEAFSGSGNDFMIGNQLSNGLIGGGGHDTLNGGDGSDGLWSNGLGSTDAERMTDLSYNVLIGGPGTDFYYLGNQGDIVTEYADEGNDWVNTLFSHDLGANVENLSLWGDYNADGRGNALNNYMSGNNGWNDLYGYAGNDTLDGDKGFDYLYGGVGDDLYLVDHISDRAIEANNEGIDTVRTFIDWTLGSYVENLILVENYYDLPISGTGNELDNSITGNSANNTLIGLDGNDSLDGGIGADTLTGGLGNDTFTVDNAGDVVTEITGQGSDLVLAAVTYALTATLEGLTLTGTNNINGTGNDLDNLITGNSGLNTLTGGLGNDTYIIDNIGDAIIEASGAGTDLIQSSVTWILAADVENLTLAGAAAIDATGNGLANVLTGNSGNNRLEGGAGIDTLNGGAGNDTFVLDTTTDTITELAGEGTDQVSSSVTYALAANFENLTLTGAGAIDGTGNAADNWLIGNTAANSLTALDGNDTLDGGAGADTMTGGLGNDIYFVDNAGDIVSEFAAMGNDTASSSLATYVLTAEVENLILSGTANISGTGNGLANNLTGNIGNNTLDGGAGSDTMTGGAGNDSYIIDNVGDIVGELAAMGNDTVSSSLATYILAADVENLILSGTADISGTGNGLANSLTGNAGNNTLNGDVGADTMTGGAGNDSYIVDMISELVIELGSQGNDTVVSWITEYILAGEVENLVLAGTVANGRGNGLNNVLTGNATANGLSGYGGNDTINAGDGNDLLDGSSGADSLVGGLGNDIYFIDDAGDVVGELAGQGTDSVNASISYILTADVENLTLSGPADISGTGNSLANGLTGNGGNNTLDGGAGVDTMTGGAGNDSYIVDNSSDTIVEAAGNGLDLVTATASYTLSADIENLTLNGAANINATGNILANALTGNGGNNTLDGGAGSDTMTGGAGNDSYIIDNVGDIVGELAAMGNDTVSSSLATYTLATEVENLILSGTADISGTGNGLANNLTGNIGNNTLDGGAGSDTMTGGAGNDGYIVDMISDLVVELGSQGNDTVVSWVTEYILAGEVENLVLAGTVANGRGNGLNNVLTGNATANGLSGYGGNDTINAGDGNDLLDGSSGADSLVGGLGNDIYFIDDAGDVVGELAGQGTDSVSASISYILTADVENLTLSGAADISGTGNSLANNLTGNGGNNALSGLDGNDTINAVDGNDSIDGGLGSDSMAGGTGNDSYIVDNAGDIVIEIAAMGNDTVSSSLSTYTLATEVETLILSGTADINGTGNGLANSLTGNAGNNTLNGDVGADTMTGGAGNDSYVVDNAGDIVSELATMGNDTVSSSLATYTLAADVENLVLSGTADISGTGNGLANSLTGNTGNNTLDGGTGNDTMTGGAGNDSYIVDSTSDMIVETAGNGLDLVTATASYTLSAEVENLILSGAANISGTGNSLANALTGNGGNNTLNGGAGIDTMAGGAGNDSYVVDDASDMIVETAGNGLDLVTATASYALSAEIENLTLGGTADINATGNSLANALIGNAGNNAFDGGAGADTMTGGVGSDTYVIDDAGDVVSETNVSGTDLVKTSVTYNPGSAYVENITLLDVGGNINSTGNALANILTGNIGANILDGGAGNDTLYGGDGNDSLVGNTGDDIITGGLGADTMTGSTGNDLFYVDDAGDIVVDSGTGADTVSSTVSYVLTANVENLLLTGTATNATGNNLVNALTGNASHNVLDGGTGADIMTGDLGNDTYYVDDAGDSAVEVSGGGTDLVNSTVSYGPGAQYIDNITLLDIGGNINATGNSLANVLTGNTGNNILDGGSGADAMTGGLGDDIYYIDDAGDLAIEASGGGTDVVNSSVSYSAGAQYIDNIILLDSGNIDATGNSLANTLTGNAGNNVLNGGSANDILNGGGGSDILIGGSGIDSFIFNLGSGADTINDFGGSGGETIDIHAYTNGVVNGGGVTITQSGTSALITLGGGNTIAVLNTTATNSAFLSHIIW